MHRSAPAKVTKKPARRLAKRKNNPAVTEVERCLKLDQRESTARLTEKIKAAKAKWGKKWLDMIRSGRRFTRVERIEPVTADADVTYVLRPEPGWEWICQNCKTYSLIRESDMPAVLKEWEELAAKTKERGFKPPVKPTAATAGCPNCKFRPGAPE